MPKIKGPLLSIRAQGKICERLIFSSRKSGQQARFQRAQKNVITYKKLIVQSIYIAGYNAWNNLTAAERLVWINEAKNSNFTGYNLYIQNYINSHLIVSGSAIYGIAILGNTLYGNVL